jgi:hypothetical protein
MRLRLTSPNKARLSNATTFRRTIIDAMTLAIIDDSSLVEGDPIEYTDTWIIERVRASL